ncbi:MAG: ATP-binding protein [Planctomycetota bacterium]|nr:ATP-binding protein [Planctomycetota bacterium]
MTTPRYEKIDASPTKAFFVTMLTRDISLTDTILDLLDNCVDGANRVTRAADSEKPYEGRYAQITFKAGEFMIHDNCGGIPWSLRDYVWRMGRPTNAPEGPERAIGAYGIGMKRALFKLGRHSFITTQNGVDKYEVEITPKWLDRDDGTETWNLQPKASGTGMTEDGTTILVRELRDDAKRAFGLDRQSFETDLTERIAEHYARIIEKGFRVEVNGNPVVGRPVKLLFTNILKPYLYRGAVDGVSVYLAVGLTRPPPTQQELDDEQKMPRFSRREAGWTVICNDRVLVYSDKTELTGWGTGVVPRYHNQFIAIAGLVEFTGAPEMLPMTTTKRGVETTPLFLRVRDRMMEGTKLFTAFTYHWKGRENEVRNLMKDAQPLALPEIKRKAAELRFTKVKLHGGEGSQAIPELPRPAARPTDMRAIHFVKPAAQVETVSRYLFNRADEQPSTVGEECFDRMYGEAKR